MFRRIALQAKRSVFCVLLMLSACVTVGPDYQGPKLSETDLPARWSSIDPAAEGGPARSARAGLAAQWWSELSDPVLNQLVTVAFRNSPTLEAAKARLTQSHLQTAQAKAASTPSVNAEAASERESSGGTITNGSWLSMNSSWELDLFGAVRRGKEGEFAREEVQLATLADVRVSLSADVTDAYLSQLACQSSLVLSGQDMASRIATEKLTAASVESGFAAPYQGGRSKASVAEARARLAEEKAQCRQLENLLTLLTGIPRSSLADLLAEKPSRLDRLPVPKRFSIAAPSQALMQRPDIRAAERRLAAASADIGLAEADRYPRLAFNGSLGYSVTGTGGSGALSFGSWSFGPSLSLPIFDGGRRAAAVEIAKSRYEESLANFKSKARRAIQEVEDGLTRYAAADERAENVRVAASEYQKFFATVEERYREGASNLQELEDARRSMLDAQQTLLGVQKERLQAWVALNRATGGAARYEPEATESQNRALAKTSSAQ